MSGRRRAFSPRVTRLRVLRRGWGLFTAETVRIADLDPDEADQSAGRSELDLDEILDLDDEGAETGLPYGRKRPN